MGIIILIVFVLAIAGAIIRFYIKNKKEPDIQPEKPSNPVPEPTPPKEEEKEPEKPKEEEIKPKFKVGDWVVNTVGDTNQIVKVWDDGYTLNDNTFISNSWATEHYHLWTIQDAKDGDVLIDKSGSRECPFIFKETKPSDIKTDILNPLAVLGYCGIGGAGFTKGSGWGDTANCIYYPATKEQRDLLFQKMKEAGYEWNSDTKELKEIEQPPIEVPTEEPEEKPDVPEPPVIPEEKPKYDEEFEGYLNKYSNFAKIERDSYTYKYFYELFREAKSQLKIDTCHGLPILLKKENFPTLYEWGDKGDAQKAQDTLIGWLFSLQLAELKPYYRADIFKLGYEMGGYDKYTNIYGWKFEYDPNIMRILAGCLYPTMKGWCKPVTETLRREVEGSKYSKTLGQLYVDEKRDNVAPKNFFTDFRVFLPTAPAPYLSTYSKRSDRTYPNEERDEFDNLKVDRQIHEMIVENYNLNQPEHHQETVQAIADKEANREHLFGKNRETKHYKFHPVFGEDTIGIELPDEGTLADFTCLTLKTGSASRAILQSATITPPQYGRLRPGCSWTREEKKNSKTDDRRNILTNFEIEDGDGSPTGYYDKNGNWVYKDAINNPSDFEEYQKTHLYANSYPSGHSSGMFCTAMVLMEMFPHKADKILKAANQYAVNRTIARYHWTSDTINGRILGSATNAICHAASDYEELLNKSIKEIYK